MNEHIATYIYDSSIEYGSYYVYACYSNMDDYDKRIVEFYDIYDVDGNCVNEGDPFYDMPSWKEIYEYYWLPTVREAEKTHKRDLKEATK